MTTKRWAQVNVGGFGKTRAEAAKYAEDLAFGLCVENGITWNEIKVTSCKYDDSKGRIGVGIEMRVFTNKPVEQFILVDVPDC